MDNNNNLGQVPLVVVHMVTYNHASYVVQTIESALGQATNFKVKLIITDDASSDNTADICRQYQQQYPDRIDFVANSTNIGPAANSSKNLWRCFNSGAKYLAILDGDDYWCDSLKLQKQVDILQQYEDKYSVCFTDVNYVDEENNIQTAGFIRPYYKDKGYADQGDLLTYMPLPTQTSLINIDDLQRSLPEDFGIIYNADAYFFGLLTQKKNAIYLDEVTACYRLHTGGMMSGIGEMGRLKKTISSLYFLKQKGILNKPALQRVEKRIMILQVDILNMLIYNGHVSLYFPEFFNYLFYCFSFGNFDNFGFHTSRFFRLIWRAFKHKIGFK